MGFQPKSKILRMGFSAVGLLALAACADAGKNMNASNGGGEISAETFSPARIEADVKFLADDMLRGRDTGSEGYRVAANYVAAEYGRLGLKPLGTEGYFQEVPFQTAHVNQDTASMAIVTTEGETKLSLGDDYYMGGSVRNMSGEAAGDVVFLGYGVHAPELGHDDLKDMDLEGKIALVVAGAPTSFHTEIRAHHSSSTTKVNELLKRGVVGLLTVNSPEFEKQRPFKRYKGYLGMKSFDWVMPEELAVDAKRLNAAATISNATAEKLFAGSEVGFADAVSSALKGEFASAQLPNGLKMKRESVMSETFYSPNVLAVLEGSDPTLKDEYVVISAHLDHIGVSEKAKGDDKINNGALDNAAGVSVMLEVARAYVSATEKPRRSIIFAAVAAEEKGLLGAEYFAHFPTVDKAAMVANVNLDMPILLYDFTDVVAFGAERSSLGPITAEAVSRIGVTMSPDPMPEQGIFTRSDHYRFVQQGIPSVFLVTGWGDDTQGKKGGKIFMDFLTKTYHSPADEIDQDIDYNAGAKFAYVNWLITSAIANGDEKPSWNAGDFFGETFAK
jgi:Zn-dependent M28 family amino/carboxypeptidase